MFSYVNFRKCFDIAFASNLLSVCLWIVYFWPFSLSVDCLFLAVFLPLQAWQMKKYQVGCTLECVPPPLRSFRGSALHVMSGSRVRRMPYCAALQLNGLCAPEVLRAMPSLTRLDVAWAEGLLELPATLRSLCISTARKMTVVSGAAPGVPFALEVLRISDVRCSSLNIDVVAPGLAICDISGFYPTDHKPVLPQKPPAVCLPVLKSARRYGIVKIV